MGIVLEVAQAVELWDLLQVQRLFINKARDYVLLWNFFHSEVRQVQSTLAV